MGQKLKIPTIVWVAIVLVSAPFVISVLCIVFSVLLLLWDMRDYNTSQKTIEHRWDTKADPVVTSDSK